MITNNRMLNGGEKVMMTLPLAVVIKTMITNNHMLNGGEKVMMTEKDVDSNTVSTMDLSPASSYDSFTTAEEEEPSCEEQSIIETTQVESTAEAIGEIILERQEFKQLVEETRAQNRVLQEEKTLLFCQINQLQEEKESLINRSIPQWGIVKEENKEIKNVWSCLFPWMREEKSFDYDEKEL
jgi:hypothetical protein